jgi:Cu/Ag efflux pump CusA
MAVVILGGLFTSTLLNLSLFRRGICGTGGGNRAIFRL